MEGLAQLLLAASYLGDGEGGGDRRRSEAENLGGQDLDQEDVHRQAHCQGRQIPGQIHCQGGQVHCQVQVQVGVQDQVQGRRHHQQAQGPQAPPWQSEQEDQVYNQVLRAHRDPVVDRRGRQRRVGHVGGRHRDRPQIQVGVWPLARLHPRCLHLRLRAASRRSPASSRSAASSTASRRSPRYRHRHRHRHRRRPRPHPRPRSRSRRLRLQTARARPHLHRATAAATSSSRAASRCHRPRPHRHHRLRLQTARPGAPPGLSTATTRGAAAAGTRASPPPARWGGVRSAGRPRRHRRPVQRWPRPLESSRPSR